MAGVNKVILLGNLGADPEVRTLESGVKTARLRIATTETYKDKNGEKISQTEWHTVNVWRATADVAEKYLKKGSQVYIEGKIKTRTWKDKEGIDKYATEIICDSLTMVGPRMGDNTNSSSQGGYQAKPDGSSARLEDSPPIASSVDDDLPF
jgi:single-strand DNA-binding protein